MGLGADLLHMISTGYNLFLQSIFALLQNAAQRYCCIQILKSVAYIFLITSVLNLPIVFLYAYLRRRFLKSKPNFLKVLVLTLLSSSAAVSRIFKIGAVNSLVIDEIAAMLFIGALCLGLTTLLVELQERKKIIVAFISPINFFYCLFCITHIVLVMCYLSNTDCAKFIVQMQGAQTSLLLSTFFIISALSSLVCGENEYHLLFYMFSFSSSLFFCGYFITINPEGTVWLLLVYCATLWIRNRLLIALYSIILYLPRYPNAMHTTTYYPSRGKSEKFGFNQLLAALTSLTRVFLAPITCSIYLQLFNISILKKIHFILSPVVVQGIMIATANVFILIVMILTVRYLCGYYARTIRHKDFASEYRAMAFAKIASNMLSLLLSLIFCFLIPYLLGFEISTVFTQLSLIFSVLSFAARDIVNDIIQGVLFHYDGIIQTGDLVYFHLNGAYIIGRVETMSFRYIEIRQDDGTLAIISFRLISSFGNKSRIFNRIVFNTSFNHSTAYENAEKIIFRAFELLKENMEVYGYVYDSEITIRDIADITAFSFVLQYSIKTQAGSDQLVRRAFNKCLLRVFAEEGVRIALPLTANLGPVPSVSTNTPYSEYQ